MGSHKKTVSIILALFLSLPLLAQPADNAAVLWHDRGDVTRLDLTTGPGGTGQEPGKIFTFVKETMNGTAPKFEVVDENGAKWKVKLGSEARGETAAARLLWAVGYNVDEDYYRPEIQVKGLPRLQRGQEFVSNEDRVKGARLERNRPNEEDTNWSWYKNPFADTREFNGLRVMMALINNWDLKDINNGSFQNADGTVEYQINDLGASFGRTGNSLTRSKGKANDFADTEFIKKITPTYVDFVLHSRPFFLTIVYFPNYRFRTKMESVVKHVPIEDARWIGARLGQLSAAQIRDCFTAAGFSPTETGLYARVVMDRIAALKAL